MRSRTSQRLYESPPRISRAANSRRRPCPANAGAARIPSILRVAPLAGITAQFESPMSTSYASLFGRLRFGLARRLLYLWARSSRIGDSNEELAIDPQQPVIYVLPYRSLTDLIVADRECVRAGLPRPVRAPLPPLPWMMILLKKTSCLLVAKPCMLAT